MKQKSRTEYSMMNTSVALLAQVSAILMGFFTRVVFTRTLSEGYVGINGLFTDILNILSLSELGVGTAITYALYGPIARKDYEKQKILMRLFRLFYRVTALIDERPSRCRSFSPDLSSISVEFSDFLSAYLQKNDCRCTSDELYYSDVSQRLSCAAGYLSDSDPVVYEELYFVFDDRSVLYLSWKCMHVKKSRQDVPLSERTV